MLKHLARMTHRTPAVELWGGDMVDPIDAYDPEDRAYALLSRIQHMRESLAMFEKQAHSVGLAAYTQILAHMQQVLADERDKIKAQEGVRW